MALTFFADKLFLEQTSFKHSRTLLNISSGSCSTHPGFYDIYAWSLAAESITFREWFNTKTLDDVVP
jgi:hypothetical protein